MSKTFEKLITDQESTVMIVDCLNLGFRWKHSKATSFLDEYQNTVESLKRSYKASKVILACDSGSSSFRKNILPTYKQGRKDKFETQTEQEKEEFEVFFNEFNRTMEDYVLKDKYPLFRFDKCEADDIAAYIVKYKKRFGFSKVVLISSDKDWDLLIQPDVMRFSYVTRKEVTWDNWSTHYEYLPDDHISIKCLMGDSGDSIPGVPGIGPKKAHALVKEFGSCYDIIANLPIASRYKYISNLNDFGRENLLNNYKLMDLLEFCEEALGEENCTSIMNRLQ
jgi:DNA polymerase-1